MEDFVIRGNLFALYGGLLKDSQRTVYDYHINEDMSFTEIGERMQISRQAAQELFTRADLRLHEYEDTLKLQQKLMKIRTLAEKIVSRSSEAGIRELAGEIIDGI